MDASANPLNPLNAYACDPARSRGRLVAEPESPTRSPFQRDRDRIIHSTAFRRLKHKTQVFVSPEGDHYRTRLTHSIEVAQIARSIARMLGLNEDLTEALALAHDLGHPAFGHAGEGALDARMARFGGFDHNAQTLRVVTRLEHKYAAFDGLNLSWEMLEGLAKHNGPLLPGTLAFGFAEYNQRHDLELDRHASAEAQVAALADDIAYNSHDVDDGLRAGLFSLGELRAAIPTIADIVADILKHYPDLAPARLSHELVRRLIALLVDDALEQSRRRLAGLAPRSADDIRNHGRPVIGFSPQGRGLERELKEFLRAHMYRHSKVAQTTAVAAKVLGALFELYFERGALMPAGWAVAGDADAHARAVTDYVAGMTDSFALAEYRRHIGAVDLATDLG